MKKRNGNKAGKKEIISDDFFFSFFEVDSKSQYCSLRKTKCLKK